MYTTYAYPVSTGADGPPWQPGRVTTTLITGASSGIGAELARQLAARGEDLVLCARRTDRLTALAAELPTHVEVRTLDVTDADAVFEVVRGLDRLDRFVVNAGLGKGRPVGSGDWAANRDTLTTNVLGAWAQAEAAMERFRAQDAGHLVLMASMSSLRGLPRSLTAYAASKAALASLGEGLRLELHGSPIDVTTLFPGYVESEMTQRAEGRQPLISSTEAGVRAMVAAIEARRATAYVPALPWLPLSVVMRHAPAPLLRRLV